MDPGRDGETRRTVDLNAGTIHYTDLGEGPPIVFVHGFLANGRLWEGVVPHLSPNARCIVPDWPFGSHPEAMRPDSDLTPGGAARIVDEFLQTLGLTDATLVGNDSGGAVSQILVTERPDRVGRLVLTNCDNYEKFPPGIFKLMVRATRLPGVYSLLVNSMRIRANRHSPLAYGSLTVGEIDDELLKAFIEPSLRDHAIRRDGKAFIGGADSRLTMAAATRFPDLEIPVLLAWGAEDSFFGLDDARRIAAAIPDSRLVEIAGAGTFTMLDKPAEVAAAIAEFVGTRAAAASLSDRG
jgi:pimeloyl-ACP methyl ester carboxylesterase